MLLLLIANTVTTMAEFAGGLFQTQDEPVWVASRGLIVSGARGHDYLGTAAQGKIYPYRYRYRYSRQRYGPGTCAAERVDTGRLDQAVLEALLRTYEDQQILQMRWSPWPDPGLPGLRRQEQRRLSRMKSGSQRRRSIETSTQPAAGPA